MSYEAFWNGRGYPWEHDPGPPKNLSWARLFSETPNYRGIGAKLFSKEKFRWHFGPMYYRGRLGKNQVKVLIIGQEGAMDESLSHRSFTGGTGGRMQHFLNFLGINHRYLFLNTFVYPIFGQYSSKKLKWLAQDPQSPIAKQRFEIFDYVLKKNDVKLVVAVGTAAKETVQNWIISRGGNCPDGIADLSTATGDFLDPRTRVVGLIHPGAGRTVEAREKILKDFQRVIDRINTWIQQDPGWLPVDRGNTRDLNISYKYEKAPIPFRDLPLGTCWRLGNGASTSRRTQDQRGIQINAKSKRIEDLTYKGISKGSNAGYSQGLGDYPYEPPVEAYKAFDAGPTAAFTKLMMGGLKGFHWPDFSLLGVTPNKSFGWTCMYRGRPQKSTVLILADQQSHDDIFTMRALTGNSGQRLQGFLQAAGIDHSYCIIRSLPVDVMDLPLSKRKKVVDDPQVHKTMKAIINKVLSYKDTKLILTFGELSKHSWNLFNLGVHLPVLHLKSWHQKNALIDWQSALKKMRQRSFPKDMTPTWIFDGAPVQIPRQDLPYGTLRWQGSSGDRSQRAKEKSGAWSPNHYMWYMPDWVFTLPPEPLSQRELDELKPILP